MTVNHRYETFLQEQPITVERKPFAQNQGQDGPDCRFPDLGTARANIASTPDSVDGTVQDNWTGRHSNQTVLQQHCSFFDSDGDGIIWPLDTFRGFHALGFSFSLSFLAVFIIHLNLSYPTAPSWVPDPFFRIWIRRIHKDKHGSDSGTYDPEGRFIPQHFEDIFSKYTPPGQDGLTYNEMCKMLRGLRVTMDPFGWFGAFFEWNATYLMLWPEDGIMKKDDIRRIYDGSLFFEMAARRKMRKVTAQKSH